MPSNEATIATGPKTSAEMWHHCLGHPHVQNLEKFKRIEDSGVEYLGKLKP